MVYVTTLARLRDPMAARLLAPSPPPLLPQLFPPRLPCPLLLRTFSAACLRLYYPSALAGSAWSEACAR